ncbi:MAG: glycosyltransferase family 2 protein [Flavobacteriales bacterium]
MKITAAIITYNEEKNIERCIRSLLGIADEVLVVDSFSTDETSAICSALGVRFIQNKFEGHIQQKNFAIAQATHEYVLSLDADEALSDELKQSIAEIKNNSAGNGYKMNRLTNYCGNWVRHCGWYPDTKVRLIKKGLAEWTGVNPHDRLDMLNGEEAMLLHGDILHYSYYTKEDHYRQIEYFGDIAARELHARGLTTNGFMIAAKVIAQFVKSYIIKSGWLDGTTGWNISVRSAYATLRKYSKLKMLKKET